MKKTLTVSLIAAGLIALLTYFSVRETPYVSPARRIPPLHAEALYDESHNNPWGIRDTGFYGYSGFARTLMDHGVTVTRISGSLERAVMTHAGSAAGKVLVLTVAKFSTYTPEERAAAELFVRNGGSLLCIGEHENIYGSSDFQNQILRQFGMEFNNDFVGEIIPEEKLEKSDLSVLNQRGVSEVLGLRNIHHLLSASIKTLRDDSDTVELLRGDGKTIGAGRRHHKGRVAAVGDSELFWNGDGAIGIGSGDNGLFLIRLFQWLLDGRLEPAPGKTRCVFPKSGAKTGMRVFIDTSSYGLRPDGSPDGLDALAGYLKKRGHRVCAGDACDDYDARIVAGPLSEVSCPARGDERPLILLAGSYQDIDPRSQWGGLLLNMKAKKSPSIYRNVEKRFGAKLLPCVLTDGGMGKKIWEISIRYRNTRIFLHRAGALDTAAGGLKDWIVPEPGVWGETLHPGVENRNRGIPMFDGADVRNPVLAAFNRKLLVIAADDLLSNFRSGDKVFIPLCRSVEEWMRTGNAP